VSELPARFYEQVSVIAANGGYGVALDGKLIKTPKGEDFILPNRELAARIAAEWDAQKPVVDAGSMPLTVLTTTAIDKVRGNEEKIANKIASYAGTDLLCYRSYDPKSLAQRQRDSWDPLLDWLAHEFGARLVIVEGVNYTPQPKLAIDRILQELRQHDEFGLAAIYSATKLTGSAVLALALAHNRLSAVETWELAKVDENWQAENWGKDAEASKNSKNDLRDIRAAHGVLS
jgi:chaperone required for assembly of F1-ATPase